MMPIGGREGDDERRKEGGTTMGGGMAGPGTIWILSPD
jgi:hypothetical protein